MDNKDLKKGEIVFYNTKEWPQLEVSLEEEYTLHLCQDQI